MKNVALTLGDCFILFLEHQGDAFRISFIFTVEDDLAVRLIECKSFFNLKNYKSNDIDKMSKHFTWKSVSLKICHEIQPLWL